MTKEELEKLFGVPLLDYQVKVINRLLELKRAGKDIICPVRTTRSSVIQVIDRIVKNKSTEVEDES